MHATPLPFLNIVKIGGQQLTDAEGIDQVAMALAGHREALCVVHGGGTIASDLCRKLGIEPNMVEGRRITDTPALQVVVMTYAGWINKSLVASLQKHAVNAIGLSGADGDAIRAHKRHTATIDFGWVGDIDRVDARLLKDLIDTGRTPVLAPVTHDGNGQLLNTNADTIASETGIALTGHFRVRLIYVLDLPGVLRDMEDPASVIRRLPVDQIDPLREAGIVSKGMIPKLENARKAIDRGISEVLLTDLRSLASGTGTTVYAPVPPPSSQVQA